MTAGGWSIVAISLRYWYLFRGACTGFLLVGPILATGLCGMSRQLGAGKWPTTVDVIGAWRRGTRPLVWLGLLPVLPER